MVSGVEHRDVDDILGDHDPLVSESPPGDVDVGASDEFGSLDHGNDVVTGVPELFGQQPRVHLVEQEPHGVEPARISC